MAEAATSKPHLFADQQHPLEEPVDPGHSRLTQDVFSKRPPTAEDNYFHKQEEQRSQLRLPALPEPPEEPVEEKPIDRLFRSIARAFDSDWRP